MNAFDQFTDAVRAHLGERDGWEIVVEPPLRADGVWSLALLRDNYVIEVEWQRNRGFGVVAGTNLVFGSGVDEIYGAVSTALARIQHLVETGEETTNDAALELAELRKLRGMFQKDVADQLGITKSGLAQMERGSSLAAMRIGTLRKLIASLGGELVVSARFSGGPERRIALD